MVNSLWVDLGAMVARRLEAESISARLGMELAELWGILQAESDEHDLLRAAIGVVFDDLGGHGQRKPAHLWPVPWISRRGCTS